MILRPLSASVLLLAVTVCAAPGTPSPEDANPTRVSIGDQVRLPYHQGATVEGTPYVIRFENVVEDSRCAPDVQCVWAGRVRIELMLTGGVEPARDTLALEAAASSAARSVSYGSVVVRFVGYEPAPAPSGKVREPDDAVAILAVERPSSQ